MTSGFKGQLSWGGNHTLRAQRHSGQDRREYDMFQERREAREAGAEKTRGSVVQEDTGELGRERAGRVLLAIYGIFVYRKSTA